MPDLTRRDYYMRRVSEMKLEQSSFLDHWKDLAEFIKPRRGRFDIRDVNKGTKKHKSIINSHASQAHNIAQAGMFAGVMSPARPWFALGVKDPDLMQSKRVKVWLKQVEVIIRGIFNGSNFYTMAPTLIGELLLFGTGAMSHVDDDEDVARFYTHTVGSYLIAQNDKLETDTFAREYMMTAAQMAKKFGRDNVSKQVQTALDTGSLGSWFPVTQFIEPNDDFRPRNPLAKHKAFSSVRFEPGHTDKSAFLSVSGFDEFPVYVPRWGVTGEDIYGTDCPGMVTLGDVKQLQIEEKRKAQAIDKQVNPPMGGPASLKNTPVTSLPGGLVLYDGDPTRNKLEPLYSVNMNLADLRDDISKVERRIDAGYNVDLFLAISNREGIQPRNELELSKIDAERLLQLGPVLERVEGDFLGKAIDRTFSQANKRGMIPPPPPELEEGAELEVEYISSLAQAQRAVDTKAIDRLSEYVAGLVGSQLSDGKKFNADKAITEYASLIGTPPSLITSDEEIAQAREEEARQAQQAQQMEMLEQGARAAAAAGQVDLDANTPVSAGVENLNVQRGG